ncbi:SPOR domain-containing protein [Christiangramia echinicola]|uniref:Sporulation related domain-containing protein n=1 Tax=Christiangramia echinicola TaxID=279359 RepID=A0A1H1LT02_9FLAO|nr:SPOR domain-containing protein [Christiangramia echinicola]SDR77613.1 Sporulation related domain-containing protein [Christiangramia echinicola]
MRKPKSLLLLAFTAFLFIFNQEMSAQQGNVNIQQNKKIDKLMEVKTELNENNKIGDRYVIQLFYGDNGEANEVIQKYRNLYSYSSQITYEAPNYKVWIGNFRNRLEADRALLKIKENFPAAFIPKPQRK